ncbi:hypothetical protein D3C87_542470 [compost metagenome]
MHKLYSFFLIFFFNLCFSQNYKPLLVEGNKWHVTFYDGRPDINCINIAQSTSYVYKISGDSIVNGKNYKKITFDFTRYPYIRGCNSQSVNQINNFATLLREDITEKKVYRNINGTSDETALYDFSLNVGNEIPSAGYDFDNFNTTNVDKILSGSIFGKYFSLINTGYLYEGIGSSNGLLEFPGQKPFEFGHWLECFETSSGMVCNSFLANSEFSIKAANPKLYYSKIDKSFKIITSENKNLTVGFYTSSGQLLKKITTKSNQFFYLNSSFTGLLFYKITDDKVYSGKIILN